MASRSIKVIKEALLNKGFVDEPIGKHRKLRLCVNGDDTGIYTFYSHSAKECDDFILGRMAKHLRLMRVQLNDLIDCTLTKERYIKIRDLYRLLRNQTLASPSV